jgi:PAS domain S-box-containing protein
VILASLLAVGVLTYFYQQEQIQLLSHSLATTQALKNLSSGLWDAIFLLVLGMGLVLAVGLGMCWLIANQIVRELRFLSREALGISDPSIIDSPSAAPTLRLQEMEEIRDALLQERIKMEEAHAEVSQAIEERDRLFNYSIDFMCVAGFDGYFRQYNPALKLALGWSNDEFMSRPIREFVHPDDRDLTVAAQKSLYGGKSLLSFDNRYLCKDGNYRWVAWNSYPLAEKGTVLAVGRDITEHKRLEELAQQHNVELIDARNRADAANQAKSVFLANMSHELRTPLTAILGYAQILQRDKNLHQRQLTGLNTIESSGRHLLTLINDTLDFVKIEAGKLELSPHAFNLPAFLRMIADIMRDVHDARGGMDVVDHALHHPDIPVGRSKIRQQADRGHVLSLGSGRK